MLSVLLGFLGYSVLNISQAIQKIGLNLRLQNKHKGTLIWIIGTCGTFLASGLVFLAITVGSSFLVAATAGSGLASLAVFSFFVLKEKLGLKEVAGIIILVLAGGAIGYFADLSSQLKINISLLFILFGSFCLLFILLWIVFAQKEKVLGLIIGSFAGCLGGFMLLFQKVASSEFGQASSILDPTNLISRGEPFNSILAMFANPFALIWIFLSIASMIVLQFAYKNNEAIRIIPFFTSTIIVIPFIGGYFCLGENISVYQWLSLIFILLGLLLLTLKGKAKKA